MTPSPACGPKPILSTARRFPFGGRRPGPPRLEKAPVAVPPLPQGGEGSKIELPPPSPPWVGNNQEGLVTAGMNPRPSRPVVGNPAWQLPGHRVRSGRDSPIQTAEAHRPSCLSSVFVGSSWRGLPTVSQQLVARRINPQGEEYPQPDGPGNRPERPVHTARARRLFGPTRAPHAKASKGRVTSRELTAQGQPARYE